MNKKYIPTFSVFKAQLSQTFLSYWSNKSVELIQITCAIRATAHPAYTDFKVYCSHLRQLSSRKGCFDLGIQLVLANFEEHVSTPGLFASHLYFSIPLCVVYLYYITPLLNM